MFGVPWDFTAVMACTLVESSAVSMDCVDALGPSYARVEVSEGRKCTDPGIFLRRDAQKPPGRVIGPLARAGSGR